MGTYRTQSGLLVEANLQTEMSLGDARGLKKALLDTADEVEDALRQQGEAKRPTFKAARDAILKHLEDQGWKVKTWGPSGQLKTPHATAPYMRGPKVWFKAQAVYYSGADDRFNDARSLHVDIRDITPEQFVKHVERWHGH